jgi:two-component system sporulation sensor kinase A
VDNHMNSELIEETLREQQAMTFRVKKTNGRFIHTLCDGQLLNKISLTPQLIVGKELKDFLPVEVAVRKETFYERAWQGEENVTYEGEIEEVIYLAKLRPIRRDGEVIEVIASCVDISERKKTEEVLRETKELFESLIENSPDGICIADIEGTVIRVNPAFEQIYGWSVEELVGSKLPIFPDHLMHELKDDCAHVKAGKKITNRESVRRRKDGELINVIFSVSPIKNAEGRVIALAGINRDITESKRTEEFLKKSDKLNVVGQLAAGLAHEIRNPLTSLRGFIQMLKPVSKKEHYDIMISELDRINSIISEFLAIAKPDGVNFKNNDIGLIIKNVISLLESQAILHSIQIHVDLKSSLPLIFCSEVQIKQVFVNILKNAIEAMPNGGEIHINAFVHKNNFVLIQFIDQGAGIPEYMMRRVGEPFFTTKDYGTGLGLMMCYKIVESHQGSISIQSSPGKGTIVDVLLPIDLTKFTIN